MFFKSNADIEWIGLGIVDVSLPKSDWTHAAHFAAAIWLLNSTMMLSQTCPVSFAVTTQQLECLTLKQRVITKRLQSLH